MSIYWYKNFILHFLHYWFQIKRFFNHRKLIFFSSKIKFFWWFVPLCDGLNHLPLAKRWSKARKKKTRECLKNACKVIMMIHLIAPNEYEDWNESFNLDILKLEWIHDASLTMTHNWIVEKISQAYLLLCYILNKDHFIKVH